MKIDLKSELFSIFEQIKTQFGVSICTLRIDNVCEYVPQQFQSFMSFIGILHQTSNIMSSYTTTKWGSQMQKLASR